MKQIFRCLNIHWHPLLYYTTDISFAIKWNIVVIKADVNQNLSSIYWQCSLLSRFVFNLLDYIHWYSMHCMGIIMAVFKLHSMPRSLQSLSQKRKSRTWKFGRASYVVQSRQHSTFRLQRPTGRHSMKLML